MDIARLERLGDLRDLRDLRHLRDFRDLRDLRLEQETRVSIYESGLRMGSGVRIIGTQGGRGV